MTPLLFLVSTVAFAALAAAAPVVPSVPTPPRDLLLRFAIFDPILNGEPPIPPALGAGPEGRVFIVQLTRPMLEEFRAPLAAAGAHEERFLADAACIVTAAPDRLPGLRALPFVRWVGPFHPAYRLDPDALAAALRDSPAPLACSVEVFRAGPGQKKTVADAITALGGKVTGLPATGCLLRSMLTGAQLRRVAAMDAVAYIDAYSPGAPAEDLNIVRAVCGANTLESLSGFTGEGVRGEVYDSAIDPLHPDFLGPAPLLHTAISPFGDPSHGTSTYGIIFGRGLINPLGRGLLPGAERGIFASLDEVADRGLHTDQLVDPAGPYRAVFQSCSVGGTLTTAYTTVSRDLDDILFRDDLVLCQSQSNTGTTRSRPEAWAKNAVSVGGILHRDTATRADDAWAGACSIGPAADGRIKPDLSNFADLIFCPTAPAGSYQASFGGTSAATPITAAQFGLFFEMWHLGLFPGHGGGHGGPTVFDDRPHASTARAVMIHTAYRYAFTGAAADLTRVHQGWGTADAGNLYALRDALSIEDQATPLVAHAASTRRFSVPPGAPSFAATMVFTDPPGTTASTVARVNDLSLEAVSPTGAVYHGNTGLTAGNWSTLGGAKDTRDPVENIFVLAPAAGVWTVRVAADEVNADGNPATPGLDAVFSLVTSGGAAPACPADWNIDGEVNGNDVSDYINTWYADVLAGTTNGDFNTDGETNGNDISDYINAWYAAVITDGC